MAPVEIHCEDPPPVTSFNSSEIKDSYAILQWSTPSVRSKYSFELSYNPFDDPFESITLHLPSSQHFVLIKNLRPGTNYTSQIFSQNKCSKSTLSELVFETQKTILHPAFTHVMPHEIILTLIVFFIWAVILRHFFIVYNRLTLVSPQSLGGYLTRKYSNRKMSKNSSRSSSRQTLISKQSIKPQFDVLEKAVCQWRSETVLNGRRNSETSAPLVFQHVPSETSCHNFHPLHGVPSKYSQYSGFEPKISHASFYSGTGRSSYSGPLIFLTHSATPSSSRRQSRTYHLVNSTRSENVTSGTLKSPSNDGFLSPNSDASHLAEPIVVRKVSEVLLGKATNDIRRCSTTIQPQDPEPTPKPNLGRRKSLLESLSGLGESFRKKSRRTKKYEMEALKEEKESMMTPVELHAASSPFSSGSRNIGHVGLGGSKSGKENLLSETYLGSIPSSTNKEDKDISPESYKTASDVVIV